MMTGAESNASTSKPHSSFVVGFIGPSTRFIPFSRAQPRALANSCRLASASSSHS